MSYVIDPRKTWALAEARLATETDPRRRQILSTLIAHAKAESHADFDALMATVSPRAHYRFFGDETLHIEGRDAVATFYTDIVSSGRHRIEHDVERMAVGANEITTEGELTMAYPGSWLAANGIDVPDPEQLYLLQQRLLIVWEFDEDGLVICEDSYNGGGPGFTGIADRPVSPDDILDLTAT